MAQKWRRLYSIRSLATASEAVREINVNPCHTRQQ